MVIPLSVPKKYEEELAAIIKRHPNESRSKILCERIFQRRERAKAPTVHPADLMFISKAISLIECISDDHRHGRDISLDLQELSNLLKSKVG